ncbi:MAG: hypothetical protein ACE5HD_09530 [Acidobacteriota bacterium]
MKKAITLLSALVLSIGLGQAADPADAPEKNPPERTATRDTTTTRDRAGRHEARPRARRAHRKARRTGAARRHHRRSFGRASDGNGGKF